MLKNLLIISLITIVLVIGLLKLLFPGGDYLRQDMEKAYLVKDDYLGARLAERGSYDVEIFHKETLFKKLTYRFENGFRQMPRIESNRQYLFYGGSFIFGQGLELSQTLPFLFQKSFDQEPMTINMGISSWGIHQLLYLLESGRFDKLPFLKENTSLIYGYIAEHELRSAHFLPLLIGNQFYTHSVAYRIEDDRLINRGMYKDYYQKEAFLIKILSALPFNHLLIPHLIPMMFDKNHLKRNDLFCRIINEIEVKLQKREIPFYIFNYDDHGDIERCKLSYAQFIPFSPELIRFMGTKESRLHQFDRHPSRELNEKVSKELVNFFQSQPQ